MISFSSLSKRPGATLAGVFSLALSSVLLLCGAGSVPIENLLPQGAMQGDLNAGGHNLTNAATVSATNVIVSGSLTAPSGFTLPFSQITSPPTLGSLAGLSPTGTASSSTYLRGDDTWATVPAGYTLPNATTTTLGGVIVGTGLGVSSGTITVNFGTTSGTALQGNSIGATVEAWNAKLDTLASGNPFTAGSNITITGTWPAITIAATGGSLSLGTNATNAGFTSSSETLNLTNAVNTAGGLAHFGSDSSIAWLGATDAFSDTIAIGAASSADSGGVALGVHASGTGGSGSVAIGGWSSAASAGVAIGNEASANSGGIAIGANSTAGSSGVEFGNGSYGGAGVAVNGYEVCDGTSPDGAHATLSEADISTTPTNTSTPVGWIPVKVNGTPSFIPYYQ